MDKCRTCTQTIRSKNQITIFSQLFEDGHGEENALEIAEALRICCNLTIQTDDMLPKSICQECTVDLWKLFCFRQKCQEAEAFFMEIEKETKTGDLSTTPCLQSIRFKKKLKQPDDTDIPQNKSNNEGVEININELKGSPLGLVSMELDVLENQPNDLHNDVESKDYPIFNSSKLLYLELEQLNPEKNDYENQKTIKTVIKSEEQKRKQYICDICSKICSKLSHMKEHMRTHSNEQPFECTDCKQKFSYITSWKYHMNHFHGGAPMLPCPHCTATFTKRTTLNRHIKSHIEEEFRCDICSIKFSRKGNLNMHIRRYHSKKFECDLCHRTYENEEKLDSHRQRNHRELKSVFMDVDYLEEHLEQVQNATSTSQTAEQNSLDCVVCGVELNTKYELKEHYKSHPENVVAKCKRKRWSLTYKYAGRSLSCHFCRKVFYYKNHLDNHIRVHTGETPFECKVCGKKFKQTSALANHMKLHTGKLHLCPICGGRSTTKSTLEIHMRTHNMDNKQYSCDMCPARFYQMCAMKDHYDRRHSDKKYKCNVCAKLFGSKKILDGHMFMHNGCPFACVLCDRTFKTKKQLQDHLQIVHQFMVDLNAIQRYIPLKLSNLQPIPNDCDDFNSKTYQATDLYIIEDTEEKEEYLL